jgi:hypothetical protein
MGAKTCLFGISSEEKEYSKRTKKGNKKKPHAEFRDAILT